MEIPKIQINKRGIPRVDIPSIPQITLITPTPLEKATDLFAKQREQQQAFQQGVKKFATKTGIVLGNLFASGLDFTTDLVVRHLPKLITSKIPGISLTPWHKKITRQWSDYFVEIHNAGVKYGVPLLPTQKLQQAAQKLNQIEYIQPTKEWVNASTKEKLSKKHIGETLFELGPSVIGSMGAFALSPTGGLAIIGTATANDVKDSAISHGVDYEKAELLGLSTGILVSALERIVPSKIFAGNLKLKNEFIGGLAKRLTESVLLEAGTEVTQEAVQMAAEATFRDIGVDEATERTILSGLGGALGGGGMQMIASYANDVQRKEILGDTTIGLTVQEIAPEAQKGVKEAVKPEIREVIPTPKPKAVAKNLGKVFKFVSDRIFRIVEPAKLVSKELLPIVTKGT